MEGTIDIKVDEEETIQKDRIRHQLENLATQNKKSKMQSEDDRTNLEKERHRTIIEELEKLTRDKSKIEKNTKTKVNPTKESAMKENHKKLFWGDWKLFPDNENADTARSPLMSARNKPVNENSIMSSVFDMMGLTDQDLSNLPTSTTPQTVKKDSQEVNKLEERDSHEVRYRPKDEFSEEDFPRTFALKTFSLSQLPKLPMEKSYVVSPPHAGNVVVSIQENTEPSPTKDDIMTKANNELKKVDTLAKSLERLEKVDDKLFPDEDHTLLNTKKDKQLTLMQLHPSHALGETNKVETRKITLDEPMKASIVAYNDNNRKRNETKNSFEDLFPIDIDGKEPGASLVHILPDKEDMIEKPNSEIVTSYNEDKAGHHLSGDKYLSLPQSQLKPSLAVTEGSPAKLVNEMSDFSLEHSPLETRSSKGVNDEIVSLGQFKLPNIDSNNDSLMNEYSSVDQNKTNDTLKEVNNQTLKLLTMPAETLESKVTVDSIKHVIKATNETRLESKNNENDENVLKNKADTNNKTGRANETESVLDQMRKHGRLVITDDILSEKKYSSEEDKKEETASHDKKTTPIIDINVDNNEIRSKDSKEIGSQDVNGTAIAIDSNNKTSTIIPNYSNEQNDTIVNKNRFEKYTHKYRSTSESLDSGIGESLARLEEPQHVFFASTHENDETKFDKTNKDISNMFKVSKIKHIKSKSKEAIAVKEKAETKQITKDLSPSNEDSVKEKYKRIISVPLNETLMMSNSTSVDVNDTKRVLDDKADDNITSSLMAYLESKPSVLNNDKRENPKLEIASQSNESKTESPVERTKNASANVTSTESTLVDYNDIEPILQAPMEKNNNDSTNETMLHPLAAQVQTNSSYSKADNESITANILNQTSSDIKPENKSTPIEKLSNETSMSGNESLSNQNESISFVSEDRLTNDMMRNITSFTFKPLDESEIQKAAHLFENADSTSIFDKTFHQSTNKTVKNATTFHGGDDDLNKINDFPFIKPSDKTDADKLASSTHDKKDNFTFKTLSNYGDSEESKEHEPPKASTNDSNAKLHLTEPDTQRLEELKMVHDSPLNEEKITYPKETKSVEKQENSAHTLLHNPTPNTFITQDDEMHGPSSSEVTHTDNKTEPFVLNDVSQNDRTKIKPKVSNSSRSSNNRSNNNRNESYAIVSEKIYNKTRKELDDTMQPFNKTTILSANNISGDTNATKEKNPTTLSEFIDVLNNTNYVEEDVGSSRTANISKLENSTRSKNESSAFTLERLTSNSAEGNNLTQSSLPRDSNLTNETQVENSTTKAEVKNQTGHVDKHSESHITDFAAIFANKSNQHVAPIINGATKEESEVEFNNLKFASGCSLPLRVVYAIDVSEGLGSGLERGKKWNKLNNFINKISKGFASGVTQKFMVYNVEPRFLNQLAGCDEDTEYFTLADDCLCDDKSSISNPNGCSVNAPLRTENIEDWGLQGPRTGLALKKVHEYFKSDHTLGKYKNLVILVSYQDSADDITDAERSLKRDGISLVNIDFGIHNNVKRRDFISRAPGWGFKHTLRHNLHIPMFRVKRNNIEDSIPKEHKFKVSFKSFRNSLGKIIKKVCKSDGNRRRSVVDSTNRKSNILKASIHHKQKSNLNNIYDIFERRYLT